MNNDIKWRTELEIVDITTAEIIKKYQVEKKDYIIVRKDRRTQIEQSLDKGYYGIIKKIGRIIITWEVIPNPQIKIEL